jgi:hypothetical protein
MGIIYNPTIVNDGLVLYLDAANPRSYPGTGTTWFNIGSVGGSVSPGGPIMPAFSTLNNVTCFNFNQIGAYFLNNNFFSYQFPADGTNLTIDIWFYPALTELTAGDRGNLIRANNDVAFYMSWNKSNQTQSNYWYGKTNEGYHESGAAITRGTWNNIVAVWTSSGLNQYLNGIKTTAVTSGFNALKTLGLQIGWEGDSRQFSGGISSIKMYEKTLTDSQIRQNFNALRGRHSL